MSSLTINSIIDPELVTNNALAKPYEDDQMEAAFQLLISTLYQGDESKEAYLLDETIKPEVRSAILLKDTIDAGIEPEDFTVQGLIPVDAVFPLPYSFVTFIDHFGVLAGMEYKDKIISILTSNADIPAVMNEILSSKVPEALGKELTKDEIIELIRAKKISAQRVVETDHTLLTLDFYKEFKDDLKINEVFCIAQISLELFNYLEETGVIDELDDNELTVGQPEIVLEMPEYRAKYFDRIEWEKAVVKSQFGDEYLRYLASVGQSDWGHIAIYQVLEDSFIADFKDLLPFHRPTVCWSRDLANPKYKLVNSPVQETWEEHSPLDAELSWNEFVTKHSDKVQIGWIAGILLAEHFRANPLTKDEQNRRLVARRQFWEKFVK